MTIAREILILTLFNNLYLVMDVFAAFFPESRLACGDCRQREAVEVTSHEKVTQRGQETPTAGRGRLHSSFQGQA